MFTDINENLHGADVNFIKAYCIIVLSRGWIPLIHQLIRICQAGLQIGIVKSVMNWDVSMFIICSHMRVAKVNAFFLSWVQA
jgi:hypothetical protein